MGSSPEQKRIQTLEDALACIADAQQGIRATAEQLAPRAQMQGAIGNLIDSYQELQKAKCFLASLTPYGRT